MDRDQFFAKLAVLDEDRLKKVLWNLYWRGSAPMRERIEAQLDPDENSRQQRREQQPADPAAVLDEVRDFVALARSGAYLGGDRRVSPRERTRWRLTFRRLATDAQQALRADDLDAAAAALELVIDLACETRGLEYFRTEDPMQAAQFVVSDAVALLWSTVRDRHGFAGFAERAAPQLIRWESPFGWTRYGSGQLADKETCWPRCSQGCCTRPTCGPGSPHGIWTRLTISPAAAPARRDASIGPRTGTERNGPVRSPDGTACCWTGSSTPRPRASSTGWPSIPRSPDRS
jgi:hypothetical protein